MAHQFEILETRDHILFIFLLSVCSIVVVTQLCLTLCDPMDCNLPGSSVHGILRARILKWVAIPFSGDLPNPRIEPRSPTFQGDSLPSEPPGKPACPIRSDQSLSRVQLFVTP